MAWKVLKVALSALLAAEVAQAQLASMIPYLLEHTNRKADLLKSINTELQLLPDGDIIECAYRNRGAMLCCRSDDSRTKLLVVSKSSLQ